MGIGCFDQGDAVQTVPPSPEFTYRSGHLYAESVAISDIADKCGTPAYLYSNAALDRAYRSIDAALDAAPHRVAYSVKANGCLALLARLARLGASADIVSGGELARVLKAGMAPGGVVFSGVGKTDQELAAALDAGIGAIHVESEPEIDALEAIAKRRGVRAPIALRINPDIDPKTHPYIATGLHSTKFGIELGAARAFLPRLIRSPHLNLQGLAFHLGSQLLSPEPYREATAVVAAFAKECTRAGAKLRTLDAGGGWPVLYGNEVEHPPAYRAYGRAIEEGIRQGGAGELGLELIIEPGRSVVAEAGLLLTRVTYVKNQGDKRFIIVDAAMTDLIRPSLYGSYHAIMPETESAASAPVTPADVVGPVCETGDFLARGRMLPEIHRGDLLAIRGAGAYSAVMASTYNGRPLACEILVEGGAYRVVRDRQKTEDLWRNEVI
jgi:diaminopimelate decarboxylase